jgi:hypothetical protein
MKVTKLLDILKVVPPSSEIFFTSSSDSTSYLTLLSVNLEYAADGSICVNFMFEGED